MLIFGSLTLIAYHMEPCRYYEGPVVPIANRAEEGRAIVVKSHYTIPCNAAMTHPLRLPFRIFASLTLAIVLSEEASLFFLSKKLLKIPKKLQQKNNCQSAVTLSNLVNLIFPATRWVASIIPLHRIIVHHKSQTWNSSSNPFK